MKSTVVFICIFCVGILHAQDSNRSPEDGFIKLFADSARCVILMERDTAGADGYETLQVTTITPSYHVQRIPNGDWYDPIVISEIDTQISNSGAEVDEGHIGLSARGKENGSFSRTLWRKQLDANAVNYADDYFESMMYGCCGAENTSELFRYTDGASILMMTSHLFRIRIPNTGLQRYFGVLTDNASRMYEDIHDSLLCAVVTYTDPETLKSQRLVVDFKDQTELDSLGYGAIEKVTITPLLEKDRENYNRYDDIDLWSKDGKSDPVGFSDFTIDLHVFENEALTLSIPIIADKIVVNQIHSKFFDVRLQ